MEPIISPWLIWLLDILGEINVTFAVTLIIFIIAFIIVFIIFLIDKAQYGGVDNDYDKDWAREQLTSSTKRLKFTIICCVISAIVSIFVPSKQACIEMIATNYITEDNINAVSENTKEAIDYIFDKIEELTNENSNQTS